MPRHMSFAHTTDAIRKRTKTVTRRVGWRFLKPGDELFAVEKMTRRRGEQRKVLARLRVVDVRIERLWDVTICYGDGRAEAQREGLGDLSAAELYDRLGFVTGLSKEDELTRIEFHYV